MTTSPEQMQINVLLQDVINLARRISELEETNLKNAHYKRLAGKALHRRLNDIEAKSNITWMRVRQLERDYHELAGTPPYQDEEEEQKPAPATAHEQEIICTFCEKRKSEVPKLLAGPFRLGGSKICSACVDLCYSIVHEEGDRPYTEADVQALVEAARNIDNTGPNINDQGEPLWNMDQSDLEALETALKPFNTRKDGSQ